MKSTKLVRLLKTFSHAEVKKFRDFVKSPFYNKNKNVIKLNEALLKFYPKFDSGLLNEEYIYSKVFGREKFDYFKIKNVTSDLYNLGTEFLKLQPNVTTAFYSDYNLIVQLRMRKLWGYHKKMVLALEKAFDEIKVKDSPFLYDNYLLTMESHLSNVLEKPNSIERIQSEFDSFYEYSILNLLKFYNLMMHISKENRVSIDMKMFDDVINYLEKNPVSLNPTIISYKYLVLLAAKRKEEDYFFLKRHFMENFDKMSYEDSYYVHMYIVGYCTDKYNINADKRFIDECYDLLKHSYINNRITLGEMLYPNFINYVKVFARSGDIMLAEKFINDWKGDLPAKQLDNCLNFSYAYMAHKQGELNKALSLIAKVNFPWIILKIQVKLMQIQLNYELGYYEETRELVESFRKTVSKESNISEDYKNSVLNFTKHLLMLVNIKQGLGKEKAFEAAKLYESVLNIQPNHFGIKFWLMDRIDELGIKYNRKKVS